MREVLPLEKRLLAMRAGYADYRARTPMLVPRLFRRLPTPDAGDLQP